MIPDASVHTGPGCTGSNQLRCLRVAARRRLSPTPRAFRQDTQWLWGSIAVTAFVLVSGCTSARPPKSSPTPRPSPSVTSALEAQVLAAYRDFWDVYIVASDPMNPEHPRLGEVATGEQLKTLGSTLLAAKAGGEVFRGSIDLAPRVVDLEEDRAVVRDCYDDHILAYDAKTGELKDTDNPLRRLVTAELLLESGRWKVASIKHEGDGCAP